MVKSCSGHLKTCKNRKSKFFMNPMLLMYIEESKNIKFGAFFERVSVNKPLKIYICRRTVKPPTMESRLKMYYFLLIFKSICNTNTEYRYSLFDYHTTSKLILRNFYLLTVIYFYPFVCPCT